ncbi:hypothetical protein B4N89_27610 [Embleya scabrispora]|uniref:Uncharacterized protein n=1 Tax=Embleya scabrispora TaxID=159449 RepID=A0A1T3P5B7_9ACTN|nr:hypothetical protein [Embleya scabrispora]OPC84192.1 hypothetical protein B4N89_27610 [Embleya scabrispora]
MAKDTYEPSARLLAVLAEFEAAQAALALAETKLRETAAEELRHPDASPKKVAEVVPWSHEKLRGIAREYGVPLKRPPTVRSIRDTSDPSGGPASG